MTTAQKYQRLLAEYGREISLERAEQIWDLLRRRIGVGFSAHGREWDEDRILDACKMLLDSQKGI